MNANPKRDDGAAKQATPPPAPASNRTAAPPAKNTDTPAGSSPPPPAAPAKAASSFNRRPWIKRAAIAGLGLIVLAAACWFGIPYLILVFNTVSTDDAYVNGHVTAVAARVRGQVVKVFVDDNDHVKKGDQVVALDKQPYQVQVEIKKANLAKARADLVNAEAELRGLVAKARAARFKLENTIDQVNNKVVELRVQVAALEAILAKREFARQEYQRYQELMKTPGATTQQILEQKQQDYSVAKANVRQALDRAQQTRAYLGLPIIDINADAMKQPPKPLAEVPPGLDQNYSAVRQAAAELMQAAAPLGIVLSSFDLLPKQILQEFYALDPWKTKEGGKEQPGAVDRIIKEIMQKAPILIQANAVVEQAQADLDQAELNLSYTDVWAEIDGVITRRNVNRGNNVTEGQSLMAIRSLTEIWIDANFKETQLAPLRIGQPVKIEVDMYGSRHEFEGRITGFTMGTGQTLSLLPPQNATGNFVKIVQRLPVKVELLDYDPQNQPLLVGLSCTPYVYIYQPLVGNDPGKGNVLQPPIGTNQRKP